MKENRNNVKRIEPHKQRQWARPITGFWKAVLHLLDRAGCFQKQWRRCRCKRDWRPEVRRMSRHRCGYFFVRRHGAPLYGRAMRGSASCAGPDPVRQPAWFRPPRLASGQAEVIDRCQETIMPKLLARILRGLFPLQTKPVSTLPSRAEARALGALLVSQGKRAVIYQDRGGHTVSEVSR